MGVTINGGSRVLFVCLFVRLYVFMYVCCMYDVGVYVGVCACVFALCVCFWRARVCCVCVRVAL